MGQARFGYAMVITLCAGLVSACTSWGNADAGETLAAKNAAAEKAARSAHRAKTAKAAKVKANELGQIPVLMYHRIVSKPSLPDDRTQEQFRDELERLAGEGYIPITAAEYVTGKIDIPAGKHAVVLTFDDSSPTQLTLDAMGRPKPGTAVAILQETAARHKGFRPVATFYVTRDMFGLADESLHAPTVQWLVQHGIDIGNHTRNHLDLHTKPKKEVVKEIADQHKILSDLSGRAPVTLALPYGNQPKDEDWAVRGSSYDFAGVFLAGYNPAPSPFAKAFDKAGIPRIRSMGKVRDCKRFCSTAWLDKLKDNPGDRYTSDGDPSTVAMPKFGQALMSEKFEKQALTYEP